MLARFEGPFEILEKVSSVAYQLRLPASYQGHPVINIAHLGPYHSPMAESAIDRPKMTPRRRTFEDLKEYEVESIVDSEVVHSTGGRRVKKYRVRWKGFEAMHDTWETRRNLKNAPEALREYERKITLTV